MSSTATLSVWNAFMYQSSSYVSQSTYQTGCILDNLRMWVKNIF